MSEWQDISTAPRDGTYFVTCNANGEDEYEISFYAPYGFDKYEPVGDDLFRKVTATLAEFRSDNFHRATHWMPLPPGPTP